MKVNDRGTKKWTSLMLPEHVDLINKLWEEQDHKEKPVLDEQQIAENGLLLQQALENDLEIEIKYFVEHDYKTVKGFLLRIDPLNKLVYMDDYTFKFDDIIKVEIL